jgi:serine/threonine-protein kinase
MLEICASILESEPKSPKALRPEIPDAIDAAVKKCLSRDPEGRFATVNDFAAAIAQFSGTSTERLAWIVPSELEAARARVRETKRRSPVPSEPGLTQAEELPRTSRWRPRALWFAASLVLFGAVGFFVAPRRPSPTAASAAASIPAVAAGTVSMAPRAATSRPLLAPEAPAVASIQPVPIVPRAIPRGPAKSFVKVRPAASAAGTEVDPVLQYGHY